MLNTEGAAGKSDVPGRAAGALRRLSVRSSREAEPACNVSVTAARVGSTVRGTTVGDPALRLPLGLHADAATLGVAQDTRLSRMAQPRARERSGKMSAFAAGRRDPPKPAVPRPLLHTGCTPRGQSLRPFGLARFDLYTRVWRSIGEVGLGRLSIGAGVQIGPRPVRLGRSRAGPAARVQRPEWHPVRGCERYGPWPS